MAITGPLRGRVEVLEMPRVRNTPKIDFEPSQTVHDFANIALEGVCDHAKSCAPVGCAQRLGPPRWAGGNDSVRFCTLRTLENISKKCGSNFGHIAGYDQIPFLERGGQSGVNTGKRAARGVYVSDSGITKVTITLRIANQSYVSSRLMYLLRNVFYQRASLEWEQSLVGSHPGAVPAGQHEARALHGGNDNIVGIESA
jgi:hypothetical protein